MTFKRIVNVVEVVTLLVAVAFVVALFANEPGGGSGSTAKSGPGYDVYVSNCARCHGQEGQGGVGPQLAGQVTSDFPNAAAEIAVVRDGLGSMPSFKNQLSATEIQDVVAYTRTQLK
ncbi:MAG TPA: cytochrome c [Acidimicrobiia bacterium]|jgi:mono/diheme cytochrome c family protein